MDHQLQRIFHALSDPTRAAVIDALADGPVAVSVLARPHDMALPSFLKHIRVLEEAGLVKSGKEGRLRMITLQPKVLRLAFWWLRERRGYWQGPSGAVDQGQSA
ncbi:MAG: hypothetical protein RLZZ528_206 [Pseudomonadota bacterium]|jgi:DNA-binding transcriptional ArsR family regulator